VTERYSEREFSNDLPAGTVLDGDQPNTFGPWGLRWRENPPA